MDFSQFKERFDVDLDPQQEAAVQAADGPVLLLAVPGSGKTTVLVTRLGFLRYVRGIAPEHILTTTYTVFGAEDAGQMEFRTINGVCSRIIRYYERVFGRTAFRLLEEGGQKSALIGGIYRSQSRDFASESTIKALQTAITFAKNQMLSGEKLAGLEIEGVDFSAFFQAYNGALRERHLMDYDDQMVYALQILRQYPDVLRAVQKRYHYLCVDEAQDTSKIQHTIIRLLTGKQANLFMVGDEDQSIYGFRAAYPQALTQFDTVYPQARVLFLEQNYRSTSQIVWAADQFIQKNHSRRPKHMRATRGNGPDIRAISVYDRQRQYRYLCKMAEDCTTQTAILYRDNDSALPLIDQLERSGIPYCCRQVDSLFFTNRVVRDITDIIRLAQNPLDTERFLALYYKLGAGISKALAQQAVDEAGRTGESPLTYLIQSEDASPWTRKQCKALQTHMANLLDEPGDKAVYRIVHFMGYGAYLEERGGDLSKAEILEALGAQEPTPGRLLERLEELRQVVQQGSAHPDCPLVLSTIHSSKGLEYDRVILMDVADGLLPKTLPGPEATQEERDAYEEERRLFYVAMTRAREELQIFTFRKVGLESTFSREIFPPEPDQARAKARPKTVRRGRSDGQGDQAQIAALAVALTPGTRLLHRRFGPGTLSSRAGDIAVITFDSGEVKKIALSVALRSRQLQSEHP